MPKIKTRKSAAKRFSFTGTGKVKYKKQGLRHKLTKKSAKRKKALGKTGILTKAEQVRVHEMMPYGK